MVPILPEKMPAARPAVNGQVVETFLALKRSRGSG